MIVQNIEQSVMEMVEMMMVMVMTMTMMMKISGDLIMHYVSIYCRKQQRC